MNVDKNVFKRTLNTIDSKIIVLKNSARGRYKAMTDFQLPSNLRPLVAKLKVGKYSNLC